MKKVFLIQHPIPSHLSTLSTLLVDQIIAHINFTIEQVLPTCSAIAHLTQLRKVTDRIQLYCHSSGLIHNSDNTIMHLNAEHKWQKHNIPEQLFTGRLCEHISKIWQADKIQPWLKWSVLIDPTLKRWRGYLTLHSPEQIELTALPKLWLELDQPGDESTSQCLLKAMLLNPQDDSAPSKKMHHESIHRPKRTHQKLPPAAPVLAARQPSFVSKTDDQTNKINTIRLLRELYHYARSPLQTLCYFAHLLFLCAKWLAIPLWKITPGGIKHILLRCYGQFCSLCLFFSTLTSSFPASAKHEALKISQRSDNIHFSTKVNENDSQQLHSYPTAAITRVSQQHEKILTSHSDMLSLQS